MRAQCSGRGISWCWTRRRAGEFDATLPTFPAFSSNKGFFPLYSVDAKTEEVIQRLLRKRFTNHTIIAVAHRLDTIMDFDKVAVLDAGKLVELGAPYDLLDRPESAFAKLYQSMQAD